MNLFDAVAASLRLSENESPGAVAKLPPDNKFRRPKAIDRPMALPEPQLTTKPVIQFSLFPTTLNKRIYENALSDSNPNGDQRSQFAFRQLVDPVPCFTPHYIPSSNSIEAAYKSVIETAIATEEGFVANAIAEARKLLSAFARPSMAGAAVSWCPVNAVPHDWYDASNDRYQDLKVDLSGDAGESLFGRIGAPAAPPLRSTFRS